MVTALVYIGIGFLSAIGWYGANKTLLEPYGDPYFEKIKAERKAEEAKKIEIPTAKKEE
jgi:hypothetical protein